MSFKLNLPGHVQTYRIVWPAGDRVPPLKVNRRFQTGHWMADQYTVHDHQQMQHLYANMIFVGYGWTN